MLLLTATTDKLQLVTDSTATVDVTACGMDVSGTTVTGWRQNTAISTAATTDIVAAPAASTARNDKTLHVRNKHATLAVTATVQYNANGTIYELHRETLQPGDHLDYVEGVGFFRSAASSSTTLIRMLSADATGQNVATTQPWFPSTGSATVAAATTYYVYGMLSLVRSAGTTSHTTSLLWGGTATLTSIQYRVDCNIGDVETTTTDGPTLIRVATATAVKAASVSATEAMHCLVAGIIRVNAGGTLIPQFQYSAAPGGAPLVKGNTYLVLQPFGSNVMTAQGPWA